MYNMCAEHMATETGTGMLWHAVDGNAKASCARSTPGVGGDLHGC